MRREYAACMSSGARAEGSGLEARSGVARTQMFVDGVGSALKAQRGSQLADTPTRGNPMCCSSAGVNFDDKQFAGKSRNTVPDSASVDDRAVVPQAVRSACSGVSNAGEEACEEAVRDPPDAAPEGRAQGAAIPSEGGRRGSDGPPSASVPRSGGDVLLDFSLCAEPTIAITAASS